MDGVITVFRWLCILTLMITAAAIPASGVDYEAARVRAVMKQVCPHYHYLITPRDGLEADLDRARRWNALMINFGSPAASMDRRFLLPDQVVDQVEQLIPLIGCAASAFELPPDLLAGIIAAALDLDYNPIDRFVDGSIALGWGEPLTTFDVSAGYAQVHYDPLSRALMWMGRGRFESPLYQAFFDLIQRRDRAGYIRLASRFPMVGILSGAAMTRYYTDLRMGSRGLDQLTLTDKVTIWSAYRGGVSDQPADPASNHKWGLSHYMSAQNPYLLGDMILAAPYFAYFQGAAISAVP